MLRIHTRSKMHGIVFGGTKRVCSPITTRSLVSLDVIAAPVNSNNKNDYVDGTFRRVLAASGQEWASNERR